MVSLLREGCIGMSELIVHTYLLSDFTSDDQRHSHPSKGLGVHESSHQGRLRGCSVNAQWILREGKEQTQSTSVLNMGCGAVTLCTASWTCWRTAHATLHAALLWQLENFQDMGACHGVMLHCVDLPARAVCHYKSVQCRHTLIWLRFTEGEILISPQLQPPQSPLHMHSPAVQAI